jgi:hypothetical protein
MKRASIATTRTLRSSGPTSLSRDGATPRAKITRKRPPQIVLLVACSQRKRIGPLSELQLASLDATAPRRAGQWKRRLLRVDAPQHAAQDLYMGDHWRAVCQAYQLARQYSSGAELWIISAGYGLIAADEMIKPYSATFASGAADSVWRGPRDGDREACLRQWWRLMGRGPSLPELVQRPGGGAVVVAAGAAYLTAISADLEMAVAHDPSRERVSVISAGARGNGALLPVSGDFRGTVGGTDSSLNARLLARLAAEASTHHFRRTAMATFVAGIARDLASTPRVRGRRVTDEEVIGEIKALRRRLPFVSRTQALRGLRERNIACEQSRFASLWNQAVGSQTSPALRIPGQHR